MKILVTTLITIAALVSCEREPKIADEWPETEGELYFPPITGSDWATTSVDSLGWDQDVIAELLLDLEDKGSRAFLVLKDGKIVIEEYWGKTALGQNFNKSSYWYWASAAKTLTSFLVGQAQEDGFLDIDNPSSDYLGKNWTSLTETQEEKITVWNQLTMTSGLDEFESFDCTDPECLVYKAEPGKRWTYHNSPYTLLDGVIEGATQEDFEDYFDRKLADPIGLEGFWQYVDNNHLYLSTPRSMARFGLLMLNEGNWNNEIILEDTDYISESINTSQNLNLSYGYLWWLNGKGKSMLPGLQLVLNKDLTSTAPADMYAAMGKNAQYLNIVPSQNLIVIRMGDNPDLSLVPTQLQEDIWEKLTLAIND